jgi:hypothetical protein
MTRLTALMFVAAIAIWGLASIPDGSRSDRGSTSYRRSESAKAPRMAFGAPAQRFGIPALHTLTLVAMRSKAPTVPE